MGCGLGVLPALPAKVLEGTSLSYSCKLRPGPLGGRAFVGELDLSFFSTRLSPFGSVRNWFYLAL